MSLTHEEIEIVTTKLFKVMDGRQHHHFAMARWLSDSGLLDKLQCFYWEEGQWIEDERVQDRNAFITELLTGEDK